MRARNFRRRAGSGLAGALDDKEEGENMMDIPRAGKLLYEVHDLFYAQSIHSSTADGRHRQGCAQATTGGAREIQKRLIQINDLKTNSW
jgi:hypothetical protein